MVNIERRTLTEQIDSDAFRIEYRPENPDQVLFNDIVSYLGEYRFNLQEYSYDLVYFNNKLRDPHRKDPMEELSQRAIDLKKRQGKSSVREQAETKGFRKIDSDLISAKDGQTILWASPPGPREEGYGDYGFIYFGKVDRTNGFNKKIDMTAIRVENPTIEGFNKAVSLISFQKTNHISAEDFLANPKILEENVSKEYVNSILKMVFLLESNKEELRKFEMIIQKMFPLISDFIQLAKDPWIIKEEKIRNFYTLENYALKLKKDYRELQEGVRSLSSQPFVKLKDILDHYSYTPPKAAGSCGSTSRNSITSNVFNRLSSLNDLFSESEWFTCPKCSYKADGPVGDTCPGCGLTKEEYVKESRVSCG